MSWFIRLFWAVVFLFCINIALQIYYANTEYSKVEHFKAEMEKTDAKIKIKNKIHDAKIKIDQHLGVYNSTILYLTNIINGIQLLFTTVSNAIISIITPKLYAIIG